MRNSSIAVKNWRNNTKQRIINAMGGKCQICGYSKCAAAFDLHHINPIEKEFSFGRVRANPQSWQKIVMELKKCVLLCANCHRELHDNFVNLPKEYSIFDEDFIEYKAPSTDSCPMCGKEKPTMNRYCSLSCAGKSKQKVPWDQIDLLEELKTKSKLKIARELDISEMAVRKRLKKLAGRTGIEPVKSVLTARSISTLASPSINPI